MRKCEKFLGLQSLLVLGLVVVAQANLQERILQGTCCSQCTEAKTPTYTYTPEMAKVQLLYGLEKNYPDSYFLNVLASLPIEYTSSFVNNFEELKFREEKGLFKCGGNLTTQDGRYYAQYDEISINVLFQSLIMSLETDLGPESETQRFSLIAFLRQSRDKFNQMMVQSKTQPYVYAGSKIVATTEEVAKNLALGVISMTETQFNLVRQLVSQKCFFSSNSAYSLMLYKKAIRWSISKMPIIWDFSFYSPLKQPTPEQLNGLDRLADYLTRPAELPEVRCPRDFPLQELADYLEGVNTTSINLSQQQLFGRENLNTDWPAAQRNAGRQFLQKIAPLRPTLKTPTYLKYFRDMDFNAKIFDSQGQVNNSNNGVNLNDEAKAIWANLNSMTVGSLLYCARPTLLSKLKITCPGACTPC